MTGTRQHLWLGGSAAQVGFVLSMLCLVSGCKHLGRTASSEPPPEEEIRAVLTRQVNAWNAGDIDLFMETYVKTDALRFASGGTVRRGWQQTLERYRSRYPTREAMGKVTFVNVEIKRLSSEWAEAFGEYKLQREGNYQDASGLFTLLLFKTGDGWRILHDHTSAAE